MPNIRAFAAIADAEEVIARPALLAAFAAVFGPEADATLVLAAPEVDMLPDAFATAAAAVGLDDEALPDILALPIGSLEDVRVELAAHMHAVFSDVRPVGELARLPWCTGADSDRLRRLCDLQAACVGLRERLPERLALPAGYRGHDVPAYFDDTHRTGADIVHQPHVYKAAAAVARRVGATHIIDIGCGAADKLVAFAPEFELIGVDFGVNLEHCRSGYPQHMWLEWDLDHEPAPDLGVELLRRSVVVCADVIEHLVDPTALLVGLGQLGEHAQAMFISTPDRERVRGLHDLGPSPNLAHVREWTLSELTTLLDAARLTPAFAGHTLNNDRYRLKRTSLVVVDPRRARPTASAPHDFRVLAIVRADGEDETVADSIGRLADDGVEVVVTESAGDDLAAARGADWVIHLGAGEVLESPWPGIGLRDALFHVQRCGYDAVDHTAIEIVAVDGARQPRHFRFATRPGEAICATSCRAADGDHRVFPYRFLTSRFPTRQATTEEHQPRSYDADFPGDYVVERLTGVGTEPASKAKGRRTATRALSRPRVVMTLLVRDEIDVIRQNLDYHLAHGVDFVIATDHLSSDGTTGVLEEFEAAGQLRLIRETAPSYDQEHWVTRMARLAATEHGADWVLNVDADEFWWTDTEDLAATLGRVPGGVDRVLTWRYNFVPRPEDGTEFLNRMRWRATRSVTWDGMQMGPKVCHRASPEVVVPMGNHDAHGLPGAYTDDTTIRVLHFPWRTRAQVSMKAVNGARAIELRPELGVEVVSHWRRLAARERAGDMDAAWTQMCIDDGALAQMLVTGTLVEDLRLRDALVGLSA
jgi:2-polyprenyl-3-methyl-5-hydroxy-6-metoxy-1,4-benzoquinol methylase